MVPKQIVKKSNGLIGNMIIHNNGMMTSKRFYSKVAADLWSEKSWTSEMRTPAFVVDLEKLDRNCQRMIDKASECNLSLRPHVKTHKTLEGALRQTKGLKDKKIVVSTLSEAEFYAPHFNDIHYAVPISSADKLKQVEDLTRRVKHFHIDVDNESTLKIIEHYAKTHHVNFSVFVQVDSGQHRVGVDINDDKSIHLVKKIHNSHHLNFSGLYTHDGHSYGCNGRDEIVQVAIQEAQAISSFAEKLKQVGIHSPTVAVGSTPTCSIAGCEVWSPTLVNELHPGNYIFYDWMQTQIGSCDKSDCAALVVASVIGHRPNMNQLTIDAGALALSKDAGVSANNDIAYGAIIEDDRLYVKTLTQEIGILTSYGPIDFEKYPIGSKLTIIPNHSCLSAALFDKYHVVNNFRDLELVDIWKNVRGW